MKTLQKLLMPTLLASMLLAGALAAPETAEAGPRRRVVRPRHARVVVAPRPHFARTFVVARPAAHDRVWIPGHWRWIGFGHRAWVAGHWSAR